MRMTIKSCILQGPGWEGIVDVVPGGTEPEIPVKMGSWAGRTHSQKSPGQVYWSLLFINRE